MPPVRSHMLAVAATASFAHAGVAVHLVPTTPGPYQPGQTVDIEVLAQLTVGSPQSIEVRELQFGLADSDLELVPMPGLAHPATSAHGDLFFWNFSSLPLCANDPASCGYRHAIDDSLADNLVLNLVYEGAARSR